MGMHVRAGFVIVALFLTATSASAGRLSGPEKVCDAVDARSTDSWTVAFRGGRLAEFEIAGDGDTDLDFSIIDENGNVVARDNDETDYTALSWQPRWTGEFTIRIHNAGSVYNRYCFRTN